MNRNRARKQVMDSWHPDLSIGNVEWWVRGLGLDQSKNLGLGFSTQNLSTARNQSQRHFHVLVKSRFWSSKVAFTPYIPPWIAGFMPVRLLSISFSGAPTTVHPVFRDICIIRYCFRILATSRTRLLFSQPWFIEAYRCTMTETEWMRDFIESASMEAVDCSICCV